MPGPVKEAFLLCGGEGERLGFAKEMLRVDGEPLAVAMVRRLQRLFDRVAVVTNHPAYLEHCLDVPVLTDVYRGMGPLAGIHAGLSRAEADRAFFLACDMPLVADETVRRLAAAADDADAPAVVALSPRGPQPLCGVYSKALLPALERRLSDGTDLSATAFLDDVGAGSLELPREEARGLRDIDRPADVARLREAFDEVEPLPVRRREMIRLGGSELSEDIVVDERPFALHVNGVQLVSILCMPSALRELAVGFLSYMGLIGDCGQVRELSPDYEAGRIVVRADAAEADLRKAVRLQISTTCGASVYGGALRRLTAAETGFRASRGHLASTMNRLRAMAPVFARTGATHQAAFTDGRRVLHLFEDVGRHNAIDKVFGRCLMDGTDTGRGALLATGRLNAEMVVKALRQGTPVVVSRSAVTSQAIELALAHGVTLVGFARGRRVNLYTCPERVTDDEEAGGDGT